VNLHKLFSFFHFLLLFLVHSRNNLFIDLHDFLIDQQRSRKLLFFLVHVRILPWRLLLLSWWNALK
jgi:hypothetical protein